jgi:hypothetical protein
VHSLKPRNLPNNTQEKKSTPRNLDISQQIQRETLLKPTNLSLRFFSDEVEMNNC